ncbi:hypothetical protein, partial [Muriicola sp.]
NTSFTDQVELDAVTDLNLNATSSEVRINKLIRNLISRNDLGALYISTVDPSFKKIDIEVRNGEMECVFPNAPFAVSVKNTQSDFNYPASWVLKTNKEGPQILYTGNSGEGNADRVFKLNTAYSSVVLQ